MKYKPLSLCSIVTNKNHSSSTKVDFESELEFIILSCPRIKSMKNIVTGEGLQGHTPLAGRGIETVLMGNFGFSGKFQNTNVSGRRFHETETSSEKNLKSTAGQNKMLDKQSTW